LALLLTEMRRAPVDEVGAPTALEAALSSGGVLGPTRGEGRATGRVVTGGDQKEKTGVWAVRLTDVNRR
jgi:hypothetical protein